MTRTVDLVVCGDRTAAIAAALDALHRGRTVLVVCSGDARAGRRLRQRLCRTAGASEGRLAVATGATVVCADGINGVEAVVIRYGRTGRLRAVNASALVRETTQSAASRAFCLSGKDET